MALNPREIDLIVRATIDEAIAPLSQLTEKIGQLSASLVRQRADAEQGVGSEKEFARTIQETTKALEATLRVRSAINEFERTQKTADVRQNLVVEAQAKLAEFRSTADLNDSKDVTRIATLEKSVDRLTQRYRLANDALEDRAAILRQIGVLEDRPGPQPLNINRANADISNSLLEGLAALKEGRAAVGEIAVFLQRAANEARAAADAEKELATATAKAAAEQAKHADMLERARRAIGSFVSIENAKAATAAQKEQAEAAAKVADEAARAAKEEAKRVELLERARRAIGAFVGSETGKQQAAEAKAAAAAQKDLAQAAQETADATARAAREAAKHAEMVERARRAIGAYTANENAKAAADALKAGNEARKESVASIEAEAKVFEALRDQIAQAQVAAQRSIAQVAAARAALAGPASLPAPGLATRVRETLAPPPGAATGTVVALQSEIERINAVFTTGGSTVHAYATEVRNLDAALAELQRQAGIVQRFNEATAAVNKSRDAFIAADAALAKLNSDLAGAKTSEEVARISKEINTLQRQIGSPEGGGLARQLAADRDALAREEEALHSIGATVTTVGEAYVRLTNAAVAGSNARTAAVLREREAVNAALDEARTKEAAIIAALSKPPSARTAPASQQVGALVTNRGSKDIEDTAKAVDDLDKVMGKGKLTAESYNATMDQIFAIQRQIVKDANLVDQFHAQTDQVNRATLAFEKARNELRSLEEAAKSGSATLRQVQAAQANLDTAGANLERQRQQQVAIDQALKTRRIDTRDLTAETEKLVTTMGKLNVATKGVQESSGKAFGLGAYQFQNLQFQINDVVTQLSLGQGILQTFSAQAGQIFQIFDLSIAQMKQLALAAAVVGPPIVVAVLAFERLFATQTSQRQFAGALAASVDGAGRSAAALVKLTRELEHTGLKFADANKAARAFLDQGLSDERIKQFGLASRNMSQGLGVDIGDAIKTLATIPSASGDELNKLLLQYHALTPELAAYIIAQTNAGNVDAARAAAIDALSAALQKARDAAIGPLDQAFIDLKNAFNGLLDAVGNDAALRAIVAVFREWLEVATKLVELFKGSWDFTALSDLAGKVTTAINPLLQAEDLLRKLLGLGGKPAPQKAIDDANKKVDDLNKKLFATHETYDKLLAQRANQSFLDYELSQIKKVEEELAAAIVTRDKLAAGMPAGAATTPGAPGGKAFTPGDPGSLSISPQSSQLIDNTAKLVGVSQALADFAKFIAQVETGGNQLGRNPQKDPNAISRSSSNALGMFQVEPDSYFNPTGSPTKRTLGDKVYDLTDPVENVKAGLAHLAMSLEKYGGDFREAAKDYVGRGTSAAAVQHREEYLAKLDKIGAFGTRAPGLGRQSANEDAAQNVVLGDNLQRQQDALRDGTLKGNSPGRIAQDAREAAEMARKRQEEAQKLIGAGHIDIENQKKLDALNKEFEDNQRRARDKEEADARASAENAVAGIARTIDQDAASKGDIEAARRLTREKIVAQLNAIDKAVREGLADGKLSDGRLASDVRAELVKNLEGTVQSAAATAADVALKDAVAIRDTTIAAAMEKFKTGALTITQLFEIIAKAVTDSAPKITTAKETALRELQAAPQTPARDSAIAAAQRVQPSDRKAFDDAAQAGFDSTVGKQVSTRDSQIKEVQDRQSRFAISQKQAETEIQAIYARTGVAIRANADELQKNLDLQKQTGEITPEVYEKITAAITKAKTETNNLTNSQRQLIQGIENSIVNRATAGFESIANAIGAGIAGTEKWSDVLKDVGRAFASFAAGVLMDIAKIIIQQTILNALQAGGGAASGGGGWLAIVGKIFGAAGSAAAGGSGAALSAGETAFMAASAVVHGGGNVSRFPAMSRKMDLSVFDGARRYHSGGVVGDVPAMLQEGELVQTKAQQANDAKHKEMLRRGSGPQAIRNVLAIGDKELAEALQGPAGEKVVLTHLKRNASSVRALIR